MEGNKVLFEENEGMTLKGSTIEQRHEIWKLLFEKNLIWDQEKSIEKELRCLNKLSFYMLSENDGFIPEFTNYVRGVKNIPFEEFKTRLSQL